VSLSRFIVAEIDEALAVVDRASSEVVAFFVSELRAFELARLLDVLSPTSEQLEALLGDRRMLRTITLQHEGVCRRCGRPMAVGSRARWNRSLRLVQHLRSCPAGEGNSCRRTPSVRRMRSRGAGTASTKSRSVHE
jgi:hypothetical protein